MTVPPAAQTEGTETATKVSGAPKKRRNRLLLALGAIVAVICVAVVVVALLTNGGRTSLSLAQPSPPTPVTPMDPVVETVSPIRNLSAVYAAGSLTWTWDYSGVETTFHVRLSQPNSEDSTEVVSLRTFAAKGVSGQNCLEVTAVDDSGRPSEPVQDCLDLP